MKFKVSIIDDEPLAISVTRSYLKEFSEFEIVSESLNGFEGLKAIHQHKPSLVFLDIQMPKINGFEMLELVDEKPEVIFTTAFDEYAIRAFEANALDYLMKPFSKDRFAKSIAKFLEKQIVVPALNDKKVILSEIDYPSSSNRIVVRSGNEIRIIPDDQILYIEAYDDYIKINIKGDCFLKKQTMQKTESHLDASKFVRVHRSFLVNINEITRIESTGKEVYQAVLRDKTMIPLSKSGYTKLKTELGL